MNVSTPSAPTFHQVSTDSTRWTVGRPGEIYVIGSKRMTRELGEINESVNRSYLRLALSYRFDAPPPGRRAPRSASRRAT
jgi:hypothetical protein